MQQAKASNEVDELIETHVHLVDHVVHQLAARFPRHVDRDELHGAGAAGLVDAAHRYDASTGVPFGRYASIRIRGAILDATRTRDWATRRLRRDLRAIEGATSTLEERLQRTPDDAEVATELGISVSAVQERRASAVTSTLLTLDRPLGDDGDVTSLADRIQESDTDWLPEAALERNELVGTLRSAISRLPELPRRVLLEHHFEGRLLRDIADDLGVTEARASQLRHEALHALQAYFGTAYDQVPTVPENAPGKRARVAFVAQVQADTTWRCRLAGAAASAPEPVAASA
ncbi:sigma-70 family RNA polymerase sigma factor [Nitriliruptor alkaliphilus]|uniref:sigma-70 family RNA polymerase sigma factor n=1 Tax=Nitriliruptor alkaliphilus TaxID=427918 RepID=UPI0006982BFC|nr:sigma-70 family RNA polymerase sigma factor [Nitriliruptor alkaliphilus]